MPLGLGGTALIAATAHAALQATCNSAICAK